MTFTPTPLPHGLTDPLRILEPGAQDWVTWVFRSLILFGLVAAWLWWRRRRKLVLAAPPPTPVPGVDTELEADLVDEVRRAFDGSGRYREGCHALASSLRRHFGRETRWPLVSRTAREIADVVRNQGIVGLFDELARLQYRRREPGRGDFLAACDQAQGVVTGGGKETGGGD